MAAQQDERDTFIVAVVEIVLSGAKKLSYFYWVERVFKLKSFFFVDAWAVGFLALSIVAYILVSFSANRTLHWIVLLVSAVRIFEYMVYLFWAIIFARPNKGKADMRSYRRSLLLLMSNYLETIFWFATIYAILVGYGLLKVTQGPQFIALIRESIVLMVANWSGNLVIESAWALLVITIHDFAGLFMTVVVGARIISLLPRPTSSDPHERA